MAASITQIKSPLNFIRNQVLICYCRSQTFYLCHNFKASVSDLYVLILPCTVVIQFSLCSLLYQLPY
jgi:hypothetical protein